MAKSLNEVLAENSFNLEQRGDKWVMNCPFHAGDHDPSFTVYPTNTYYCFGCEQWGDAVKFLTDYLGKSYQEALDYVGADYKFPRAEKSKVIKTKNVSSTWSFLYQVVLQYHDYLSKTAGAVNYLTKRGLTHSTITKYKLGYTDGNVLNLFYAWEREMALEAGLTNKSGFETLSHRITIPNILTPSAYCDFVIGRTVVNDSVKYLGLRVPKPIFGFHEVRHSPILFVVEGQFDWLLLRQWGYPAINLSGHHIPKYNRKLLENKYLVIVPDYDENEVGQKAARGLHESFEKSMILDYSRYKQEGINLDIGELAMQEDGEKKFHQVVQENIWTIPLSRETLARWLPSSMVNLSFLLT